MVRSKSKSIIVMAVVGASMFGAIASLHAANSTWLNTGSTDGNWSTTSNWLGGVVPGAASGTTDLSVATFNTAVGTYGTTGSPVVIDSGRNIDGITFDTGSVGAFFIGSTSGNPLLLSSGGMIQATSSINNNETINAPLVIGGANGTYTIDNNTSTNNKIFTLGGGITGGAAGNTTLNLAGSSTGTNLINGVIGNGSATSLGLSVYSGVWGVAATDTFTGSTTVNGGTLKVDFSQTGAPLSNAYSSNFVLGGGTFIMNGKSTSTANTESFASGTAVNAGGSTVTVQNGSGSMSLALGALSRSIGGTVNFNLTTGTISTTTANPSGQAIIGGWATVGGTNWATSAGNGTSAGNITAISSYVNDAWASGNNTTVTTASSPSSGSTTNSLRFNATGTNAITLAGTNTITTGGILVASSGTDSIGGSGSLTSGSGNELIVNQFNTTNAFAISATVADNGSPTVLTKSGTGALTLTGANTYSGGTYVNTGTVNANSVGALGGTGGGTVYVNYGGTLTQTAAALASTSAATGLVVNGGTATLNLGNTYTGTTSIRGGRLNMAASSSGVASANTGGSTTGSGATTITMASVTGVVSGSVIAGAGIPVGTTITAVNTSTKVITLSAATTGSIGPSTALNLNGPMGNAGSNILLGDTSGAANTAINFNGSSSVGTARNIIVQGGNTGIASLSATTSSFQTVTFSGNITLGSNNTAHGLTVFANNYVNENLTGVISDPTGLVGTGGLVTITGSGSGDNISLSGNNTFTGGVYVSPSAAFVVGGTNALGTGTFTINSGVSLGGSGTPANAQVWNGNFTFSNATTFSGTVLLTTNINVNGNIGSLGESNVISDGGKNYTLTYTEGGYLDNLTLSGANTFGGGLTYAGNGNSTLNLGNDGTATGSAIGTGTFTISGGTINVTATAGGTMGTNNAMVWNGDFTIGGNALNMGTGAVSLGTAAGTIRTVTVNNGTTGLIIGGVISNGTNGTTPTVSLTKAGGGTLDLTGANTFTGTTTITAGVLQVGNSLALQDSTLVIPATSTFLVFNPSITNFTVGGLSSGTNLPLVLADSGHAAINLSIGGGNTSSSYGGVLSDYAGTHGAVTKIGTGTVTLSGVNTYSGGTTVNAGNLILTGGNSTTGITTVNSGALLTIGNSTALGTAAATLTLNNGAQLDATSFTGSRLTTNNAQTWNGSFTFNGSNNLNLGTGAVTLGASPTVTVTANTLTVGGAISGGYGLTKAGAGTLVLGGVSSYSNGTTVSAGTLTATNGSALGTGALSVSSGATFNYSALTDASMSLSGLTLTTPSAVGFSLGANFSSSAMIISNAASLSGLNIPLSVSQVIGTNPSAGTYTLVQDLNGGLNGATFTLTGNTTLTNGYTIGNLLDTGTAITVDITAPSLTAAYWKGGFSGTPGTWSSTNGTSSNWTTDAGGTVPTGLLPSGATTVTFSASGASNQGGMVLGAPMSIQGMIVNDNTPLVLTNDSNTLTISSAGITINTGASVTINAPVALSAAQTWTNNSTNVLTVAGPLFAGAMNANFNLTLAGSGSTTVSGTLTGDGNLFMNSSGVLTITGNNAAFTGDTNLAAGTLVVGNSSALGNGFLNFTGPATLDANASGLTLANDQNWNSSFTFTGSNSLALTGTVTLGTNATVTVSNNTLTVNGVIGGGYGLTTTGAGTAVLNGANTYTGGTTITAGTLQLNGSVMGAITNNSALILSGTAQTIANNISGTGTVTVNSPTSTVTLTGSSTYTGNTNLVAGTLVIGNNKALGAGTLVISGGTSITGNVTGIVANAQTWNGNFTVNTNGNTTEYTGAVTLGANIAITTTGSQSFYEAGNISGSNSLTLNGSGFVALSGNNSFTGGVTLNGGVLNIGSNNALGTGTFNFVGGTIVGWNNPNAPVIPNAVLLTNKNFGLNINPGPYPAPANYGTGFTLAGTVTLTGNTTIGFNSNDYGFTGPIVDGGSGYSLTLAGGQYGHTETLSGANTFTGGLTIYSNGWAYFNIGKLGTAAGSALGMGTFTIGANVANNGGSASNPIFNITATDNGGVLGTNNAMNWNNDFSITGQPINFGTGAVTLGGNRNVTVSNGTTTIGGVISGAYSVTKSGTGKMVLTGSNTYTGGTTVSVGELDAAMLPSNTALTVATGTTFKLTKATANNTLQILSSLSIATATPLDWSNHDLYISGGAASITIVAGKITTSAAGPTINGATTTAIALMTGSEYMALGKAGNLLDGTTTVSSGDLVGVYTYGGDANLDGVITADDYLALNLGYMFNLSGWTHGDFDQDGTIGVDDFAVIDNNFQHQSGSLAANEIALHTQWFGAAYTDAFNALNAPAAVPEPASLALLGLGAVALLRRKSGK